MRINFYILKLHVLFVCLFIFIDYIYQILKIMYVEIINLYRYSINKQIFILEKYSVINNIFQNFLNLCLY